MDCPDRVSNCNPSADCDATKFAPVPKPSSKRKPDQTAFGVLLMNVCVKRYSVVPPEFARTNSVSSKPGELKKMLYGITFGLAPTTSSLFGAGVLPTGPNVPVENPGVKNELTEEIVAASRHSQSSPPPATSKPSVSSASCLLTGTRTAAKERINFPTNPLLPAAYLSSMRKITVEFFPRPESSGQILLYIVS